MVFHAVALPRLVFLSPPSSSPAAAAATRRRRPPHMMLVFSWFSPKKVPFEDTTEAVVVLAVGVDGRRGVEVEWRDGGWRGGRWCRGRGCLPSGRWRKGGLGWTWCVALPSARGMMIGGVGINDDHDAATGCRGR